MVGSTTLGPLGHIGIDDVYRDEAEKTEKQYNDIFGDNVIDSKQLYERFMQMSDMLPADLTYEAQEPFSDEPEPVASQDFYPFRASRMIQWDDLVEWVDQYDFIRKERMPMITEAFVNRKEMVSASLLTLGFGTNNFGIVAEPLFTTNHVLAGTGSNRLATDSPLSPLMLLAMRVLIRTQTTYRGNPLKWDGNMHVIVSPFNSTYAKVIMDTEKLPGTNNNDTNLARERTTISVNDYLPPTSPAVFCRATKKHGWAIINQLPFMSKLISMNAAWINTLTCRESYTPMWKTWRRSAASAGA